MIVSIKKTVDRIMPMYDTASKNKSSGRPDERLPKSGDTS